MISSDRCAEVFYFGNPDLPHATPENPLVTFAIFAYNQEKYIRQAVVGALSQEYEPLEIILSDDSSDDSTFDLMKTMAAVYKGRHRLIVRKNIKNMGLASHVNTVVNESNGDILVLAAGDDISLPDRTSVSVRLLTENPKATAVLLSGDLIDQDGKTIREILIHRLPSLKLQTIHDLLKWKHVTFGASSAIKLDVFTQVGPLGDACPTEDTPRLLRSLLVGNNVISRQKAILYRSHSRNLSTFVSQRNMDIQAIYRQFNSDIDTAQTLLLIPPELALKLKDWVKVDYRIRLLKLNLRPPGGYNFLDIIYIFRVSMGLRERLHLVVRWFCGLMIK